MHKFNLTRLLEDTDGQDLVEYALVFACVALAAIAGTNGVASNVTQMLSTVGNHLTSNI